MLYPVAGAALLSLGLALWYQRTSSRRAALATLRSATDWARARGEPGFLPPGLTSSGKELENEHGRALPRFALALRPIGHLAHKLSPPVYSASAARRLRLAGKGRASDEESFLAFRLITLAAIGAAFVAAVVLPVHGFHALLVLVLVTSLLALGPEAFVNHLVSSRQEKIRRDLPALVELLMISVEAGLGFDQALARSVSSVPGPLSEEFSRYLGEVRMGSSRREALEAIDRRTEVYELRSFLMALAQAETFGISVGSILRSQAKGARAAQHQHLQERAQKAPIKMLFPLVFCVLPALFVVVLGPAAIEIYRELIK
ncbi:MAG: type II secretion system F family protein [Acidimicrobiales bacterium]